VSVSSRRMLRTAALLLALVPLARAAGASPELRLQVAEGIEFVTDHDLSSARLSELAGHVRDVERRLQEELDVPAVEEPVRIYLFATQAAFGHYVRQHIPGVGRLDTAGRHGIFLLRNGKPYVFVVVGDDVVPSLRHETVHVVLNTSHPGLPIWIDEGLAQCYEATDGTHWSDRAAEALEKDLLRRGVPKASALAKLRTMPQLGPREYAGCWAHMRGMVEDESGGRVRLRAYLAALRAGETPPALHEGMRPMALGVRQRK
jgi:hypothetical protein